MAVAITVLKFPDSVRENPEIYLDGPNHCVYEIIDNAVDECIAGYCNFIQVIVSNNKDITVVDNGRGIPTDPSKDVPGQSQLEVAMTSLNAGGKFASAEDSYKEATGGKNGVGLSCVNAVSKYCGVAVWHNGFEYTVGCIKGIITKPQTETAIQDKNKTGTAVRFALDTEIYDDPTVDINALKRRLQYTAYMNKGCKAQLIVKNDGQEDKAISFCYENGINDFLMDMVKNHEVTAKKDPYIFAEKVVECTKLERPIKIELAFTSVDKTYDCNIKGFVNGLASEDGGDHISGLQAGIAKAVREFALQEKLIKNLTDLDIADCNEGIVGIVSVRLKKPRFAAQNKRRLDMREVRSEVSSVAYELYNTYLLTHKEAKDIVAKALRAAKEREKIKRAREDARGIKKISNRLTTLGKLADCKSNNPEECELFLVEGDSAGGSAKEARDYKTQAILPVFGKILNCQKSVTRMSALIKNSKIGLIIAALGCGIGEQYDYSKLRYHKIILFADAD